MTSEAFDAFAPNAIPDGVLVRSGRSTGRLAPGDLDILSAEERGRFAAFRDPVRAARFAAAHVELRRFLGQALGCAPAALRFDRHPCAGCGRAGHGRPYVRAPRTDWEFSFSRSGPYWLCAAAEAVRVGVDLERERAVDPSSLSPAILSADERRHLDSVPPEFRAAEFIRCWTRKEAVVKASGIGIEAALGEIDVRPGQLRAKVLHTVPGCEFDNWVVTDLPAGTDHFSAIAVPALAQRKYHVP
ncbi:4'-phosphopantetheinyl transferase family protein [Kitasatospora sp. NPDC052896]|uniref:4'-phosphopantetheinyl transferase family protein n=1 Tax=Kitasatospora sp. NPDC052896 TaxID=3364061 RepID=UPI0037C607A0